MKKIILFLIALIYGLGTFASQDSSLSTITNPWFYKISASVNPQLFYDTRKIIGAREDELLYYPAPIELDANGNDINAAPSLNMLAITTRFGLFFKTPDIFSAKTSGYIETDFTGSSNAGINMLRLRHAYIHFKWESSNLLFGQYWSPLVVHEIMPDTRPLNMGVPFHPYSRCVQGRYTQQIKNIEIQGVAAFQLDNKSIGPEGPGTQYLRYSCLPELNFQIRYIGEKLFAGFAYNLLLIQPRAFAIDSLGFKYKTSTKLVSQTISIFAKYEFTNWSLRVQSVLGENLYDNQLIGGYAESPFNYNTHQYTYTPFGCFTAWVDFGKSNGIWRPGIFLGYGKNTGFRKSVTDTWVIYGRGIDVDYVWRIQPRIGYYPSQHLSLFAEIEYTTANYGEMPNNYYHYASSYGVHNTRFILALVYTL